MTETNGMRDESIVRYDDRQPVHGRALLPSIALAVSTGLAVFYLSRLLAERAPFELEPSDAQARDTASTRTRG